MRNWTRCSSSFALGISLILGCAAPVEPDYDYDHLDAASLYAPHGSPEEGFFVPWAEDPKTSTGLLRWFLTPSAYRGVEAPEAPLALSDGKFLSQKAVRPEIAWVGHSTFAVHEGDDVFLTDPHFGPRALLPPRLTPVGLPVEAIPPDAFAVISHNHYDHLDAASVAALPETLQWFVPRGLGDWFRDHDRPHVVELDWWESAQRGDWTITCLPSQHWSRRIEQGVNRSLWCAWMIESKKHRYFFAGDTGYFHGFREFQKRFGKIDVAMLPIGAYAPRWFMKYQHMNPAEAYQAFLDLGAGHMFGMHWGTFDLTDEPAGLPPSVLDSVVKDRGGDANRVHVLAVGERWELSE